MTRAHVPRQVQRRSGGISSDWALECCRCVGRFAEALKDGKTRNEALDVKLLDFALARLAPMPAADSAMAQLQLIRQLWPTLSQASAEKLYEAGSPFLDLRAHPEAGVKRGLLLLTRASLEADGAKQQGPSPTPPRNDISLVVVQVRSQELYAS